MAEKPMNRKAKRKIKRPAIPPVGRPRLYGDMFYGDETKGATK